MKQLICQEPKQLVYQQVVEPTVQTGHVKIKFMRLVYVELIFMHGEETSHFQYPRVLGHEISGTICEVASDITQWKVRQRVAVMPYVACYECGACKEGKQIVAKNISYWRSRRRGFVNI